MARTRLGDAVAWNPPLTSRKPTQDENHQGQATSAREEGHSIRPIDLHCSVGAFQRWNGQWSRSGYSECERRSLHSHTPAIPRQFEEKGPREGRNALSWSWSRSGSRGLRLLPEVVVGCWAAPPTNDGCCASCAPSSDGNHVENRSLRLKVPSSHTFDDNALNRPMAQEKQCR